MKKTIFLLFFLLLAYLPRAGEQELLGQAKRHYIAQEYEKAAALYEQILAGGRESAGLYFNLGNSLFKSGDYVRAILNYERALLLDPRNEDIRFNLRIANQYIVDNPEPLPRPFFSRWWQGLASLTSPDGWARISNAAFLLLLVLLGGYLFGRTLWLKKAAFYNALAAAVILIISFTLAWQQHNLLKRHDTAILVCPRTTVKSAPAATGTDLFMIHEGLKVEITDSLDLWKEIRISDGNKGWMPDSCLIRI